MRFIDLGVIPYAEAEAIQKTTLEAVMADRQEDTVFLLEHPRVVTYGRQGGAENLRISEAALLTQGVELARTARGGNITCHFPGQLVAYPVIRVEKRPGGIRAFFHDMEEAVIRTCAAFGVTTMRRPGHPGVWIDETRKICSMGIGVRRWVTWHGLALNVSRDVSLFDMITLCGIPDAAPTSLSAEAGRDISVEEVKNVFKREFEKALAHSAVASNQAARG
ncbi:lipoyl(octanoyl) transferase LipB [Pseudodesulfovibrio tunisiensis]|uniref:lipoyl(octanoyl) transferase LipB n=1 Tax=Pseudodesulfovibrio tunisiensis TaxID=463192 RepID=UPI001FB43293|nr:lipoyl(octanoyl) transferase LipB [Pseudodesulfovibrio tunisiensis]